MIKSEVQETLVTLYLRLNGYFTSGFIVHSPDPGKNQTEMDVLAVRFPFSAEPERGVGPAEALETWDEGIDFVIGEVKSHKQQMQFNEALRNPRSISAVLRWFGRYSKAECDALLDRIAGILVPNPGAKSAPTVLGPHSTRVRALLFSPETRKRRDNQSWFIPGPPIFDYIWRCLRPAELRPECATTYDFGMWGRELEPVVRYFKDPKREQPGEFSDLSKFLGVAAD